MFGGFYKDAVLRFLERPKICVHIIMYLRTAVRDPYSSSRKML